jgi:hypothetical protein
VHVVVKEVSILAHHSSGSRRAVIGPENGGDGRITFQHVQHTTDCVRSYHKVRVHEEKDIAVGMASPVVSRRRRAQVFVEPQHIRAHLRGN